jgi:hypothetical protein
MNELLCSRALFCSQRLMRVKRVAIMRRGIWMRVCEKLVMNLPNLLSLIMCSTCYRNKSTMNLIIDRFDLSLLYNVTVDVNLDVRAMIVVM